MFQNIDDFVGNFWAQKPGKLSEMNLVPKQEAFELLIRGCELFRKGKIPEPAKFFINGRSMADRLDEALPEKADQNIEAYIARIEHEYNADEFLIYAFDMLEYCPELRERLDGMIHELYRKEPPFGGGGPVVLEIFMGRYQSTVGGVHKECCSTFHFILEGEKTIRLWPERTWDVLVDRVRYSQDERTAEPEYYLLDVQPQDRPDVAIDLNGRPGDCFYWPDGWWHVGISPGFTMSATVALHPKRNA